MANDTTSRLGIAACDIFFSKNDWLFREQPIHDWGIDAQIEPKVGGKPTGQLIALQIKTGPSFFKHEKKTAFRFYGEPFHLGYWTRHALPVFIVLYEPDTNVGYWQRVETRLTKVTKKGWWIDIPKANVLEVGALQYFKEGVAADESSFRRFVYAFDYPLMLKVKKAKKAYLMVNEMNHKSLSMRGAWFSFEEESKPEPDISMDRWHPERGIHNYMARMFPWLDYQHTHKLEDPSGSIEGESHRMRIYLNKYAEAFVTLEKYFARKHPKKTYDVPFEESDEMDEDEWAEWAFRRAMEKDD